jgi:nucleoside-diphosphate-sugar epimerase
MKVLVLGGTGVISSAIVKELLKKNHEVSIFNRANRKVVFEGEVEQIVGDKTDKAEFEKLMKNKKYDVVIDMICFNIEDAKTTIKVFKDAAEQIIFTSSSSVYKKPHKSLPTIEAQEELFDNPDFKYAYEKAEVEIYLKNLIKEEKLPITIVRPSLTFGIGAQNIGVLRQNYGIVDRIRKGKALVMFGDGTTPISFTFAPDIAKGYVGLVGNKKSYGEDYHITSEEICTWNDLYIEIGKIIGIAPKIVHIPSEILCSISPELFSHLYYEKAYAAIYDNSKIRSVVPDYRAEISLNKGLRMIIDWIEKEANKVDLEKDMLEDRLVELHTKWINDARNS